jgi:hypothetical protein
MNLVSEAQYPTTRNADDLAHDLESINRIPERLLSGLARETLVVLAHRGQVYAYQPVGSKGTDFWNLWIDELAERRFEREGRVPLTEWNANYVALFHETVGV